MYKGLIRALGAMVALVALYSLLGFLILPGVALRIANQQLAQYATVPAHLQRIELNPFSLELTLWGLQIGEPGKEQVGFERLYANPKVRQTVGRVALRRGPLIYCVEATDNAAGLERFSLARDAAIEAAEAPNLLGGVVTLSASGQAEAPAGWADVLYRAEPPVRETVRLTAVPYFAWDNRDPGEMLVWVREGSGGETGG